MKPTFNHVGVGVSNLDEAIRFYTLALECRLVRPPCEIRSDDTNGDQPVDVLSPPPFKHMRIAHLAMSDGVGIELFQLIDPPHVSRSPILEYWKSGLFHFCVTDLDLRKRLEMIVANGGRQLSRVWLNRPPDNYMVYCSDPWGTVIELYSRTYEDAC